VTIEAMITRASERMAASVRATVHAQRVLPTNPVWGQSWGDADSCRTPAT
jgi:hypothetical protein